MSAQALPLTAYDFECCAGRPPSRSVRGFALHDGCPLLVVALYPDDDRHVLFAEFASYFREQLHTFSARRALALAVKETRKLISTVRGPVDAVAAEHHEGSAQLLERVGFRPLSGTTYRFETLREKVQRAEALMREHGDPVEIPVQHFFSDGVYARHGMIPRGTMLTGHIHKKRNLNILSQGEMSVLTQDGMQRVKGPFVIVSPPGTKRIAYAHTDCWWTTIHGTHETDLAKIEAEFIVKTEQEWLEYSTLQLQNKEAA